MEELVEQILAARQCLEVVCGGDDPENPLEMLEYCIGAATACLAPKDTSDSERKTKRRKRSRDSAATDKDSEARTYLRGCATRILARAHVEMGKRLMSTALSVQPSSSAKGSGDPSPEEQAKHHFQSSLQSGFTLSDAHTELALLLKTEGDWKQAESHFRKAFAVGVSVADSLSKGQDDEALQEAQDQLPGAAVAQYNLALLLCQLATPEAQVEADAHLLSLGFQFRLSSRILAYREPQTTSVQSLPQSTSLPACVTLDSVLPAALLSHLQQAFAPDALFWPCHGYPAPTFFSYCYPLQEKPATSVEQLIQLLQPLAARHFPQVARASSAEWWVHTRFHDSGHQMHFDLDEHHLRHYGKVRHPVVSTVVYLSQGSGGPTLVTDQEFRGGPATVAHLVFPQENRVCFFDGSLLHGVVPGRGNASVPGQQRLTLMIGWWLEDDVSTKNTPAELGPNMAPPWRCEDSDDEGGGDEDDDAEDGEDDSKQGSQGDNSDGDSNAEAPWPAEMQCQEWPPCAGTLVPPGAAIQPVWEELQQSTHQAVAVPTLPSHHNTEFVGRWFLRSLTQIDEEVQQGGSTSTSD